MHKAIERASAATTPSCGHAVAYCVGLLLKYLMFPNVDPASTLEE